jgi:hypothetical protein
MDGSCPEDPWGFLPDDRLESLDQVGHEFVNAIKAGKHFDHIRIRVGVSFGEDGTQEGGQVLGQSASKHEGRSESATNLKRMFVPGRDS